MHKEIEKTLLDWRKKGYKEGIEDTIAGLQKILEEGIDTKNGIIFAYHKCAAEKEINEVKIFIKFIKEMQMLLDDYKKISFEQLKESFNE